MFEADLFFSCGGCNGNDDNFLPVADVWLVIDVLRATTVMTRWFELGGTELYPVKSPNEARLLVVELRERGLSPLLMGEVNGIPPEGFDLGNSPVELTYDLIREHCCGVMSTTNGTVALNEAFGAGSPVIAVSFRNLSACLEHALTLGERIGILCAGRKKRPSWEDTLCAGALLEKLTSRGDVSMSDSAKIALSAWQSQGLTAGHGLAAGQNIKLLSCIEKSGHADYLKHIGYGRDIIFASETDASTVVPVLEREKSHIILRNAVESPRPCVNTPPEDLADGGERKVSIMPNPSLLTAASVANAKDPFEELLESYITGKEN